MTNKSHFLGRVGRGHTGQVSPTPPSSAISNVAVSGITDNTATIAWDWDIAATGQIAWDTSSHADFASYAHTSTLEPLLLTHHSQGLTGLPSSTTVHYRIEGVNAQSQTTLDSDRTFATTGAGASSFPPDTTLTVQTVPSWSVPTYLVPFTDPVWGTEGMRISNENGVANYYSKIQSWNADGTRIFLARRGSFPGVYLNASTYAIVNNAQNHPGNPQMSNTDPDLCYGALNGSNTLRKVVMSTGVQSTVHTFTGFYDVSMGQGEGGISVADDRYFALIGQVTNGGTKKVIVYDRTADTVLAQVTLSSSPGVNNCMMDPGGDYFIVQYNGGGSSINQGTHLYGRDGTWVRQLTTQNNHGDAGVDSSSNRVWVTIEDSRGVMYRYSDGVKTYLSPTSTANPGHVSCRNYDRPGWAYFSPYQKVAGQPGDDVLYANKLDGSGTVEIFGHIHNSGNGSVYVAQPQATVNRAGTHMLSASNGGQTNVYCYVFAKAL